MIRRQLLAACVFQDVKTFGIGLHQAVFDAVMDHLDEMAGPDRTGMEIAALDTGIALVTPGSPRDVTGPWCQACEDRIEPIDGGLVAADHHAIAALQPPDTARGADVEIMQAAPFQRLA